MPGKLEFHYVPWNHFVFTVLCLVVCGVGIAHTRGTNLEGRFPYFAFAAILGGMHFVLMILAFAFKEQVKQVHIKEKVEEALKTMGLYRFLLVGFALWCIAGATLTGTNGFCLRGEARPQPKPAPKPALKPASKSEPKPSQKKENNPKNPAPEATEPPKITPAKADAPKVTVDKTAHNTTTVTANIVVNTTGADTNKTDSYRFQSEEEDALRLLRLHQAQEAFQNSQKGVYNGGFKADGTTYKPSHPQLPVPPPPSYETTMTGAYPAQDSLQPAVLSLDGQEPQPRPRSGEITAAPVFPPNCVEDHA